MSSQILTVEDEAKLAQFTQLELKYEDYQVTVANDGFTGLKMAREIKPDLILLDQKIRSQASPFKGMKKIFNSVFQASDFSRRFTDN